jgi:hypothetical protein
MPPHDEHHGGMYALVATTNTIETVTLQLRCDYFQRRRAAAKDSEWKFDSPLQPEVGIQDTAHLTPNPIPAEYDGGYGVDAVNDTLNVSRAAEYGSPFVQSPLASAASETTISMNSTGTTAFTTIFSVKTTNERLAEAESQIFELHRQVTAIDDRLSMIDYQLEPSPNSDELSKDKKKQEESKDSCMKQIKAKEGDFEHLKNEIRDAGLKQPKRDETGLSVHHNPNADDDSAPQFLP